MSGHSLVGALHPLQRCSQWILQPQLTELQSFLILTFYCLSKLNKMNTKWNEIQNKKVVWRNVFCVHPCNSTRNENFGERVTYLRSVLFCGIMFNVIQGLLGTEMSQSLETWMCSYLLLWQCYPAVISRILWQTSQVIPQLKYVECRNKFNLLLITVDLQQENKNNEAELNKIIKIACCFIFKKKLKTNCMNKQVEYL